MINKTVSVCMISDKQQDIIQIYNLLKHLLKDYPMNPDEISVVEEVMQKILQLKGEP